MALDWPIEYFGRASRVHSATNHSSNKRTFHGDDADDTLSSETVHLRANPHGDEVAAMDPNALAAVQAHPYFQDEVSE